MTEEEREMGGWGDGEIKDKRPVDQ